MKVGFALHWRINEKVIVLLGDVRHDGANAGQHIKPEGLVPVAPDKGCDTPRIPFLSEAHAQGIPERGRFDIALLCKSLPAVLCGCRIGRLKCFARAGTEQKGEDDHGQKMKFFHDGYLFSGQARLRCRKETLRIPLKLSGCSAISPEWLQAFCEFRPRWEDSHEVLSYSRFSLRISCFLPGRYRRSVPRLWNRPRNRADRLP